METNIAGASPHIIHICCGCEKTMDLYSSDESTTIAEDLDAESVGMIDFQIYKCPDCDDQISVVRRD